MYRKIVLERDNMSTAMYVEHVELQKQALREYQAAKARYEQNPTKENHEDLAHWRKVCIIRSVSVIQKGWE